jgi:hypothetical protein
LAEIVENELGTILDPTAMFTVQAKRIHECVCKGSITRILLIP